MLDSPREIDACAGPHFDVIVVGAGPAGLCCALGLAQQGYRIGLVERQTQRALAEAAFDGREIALTHRSVRILERLGVWSRIDPGEVSPLKEAAVMTGASRRRLIFDHRDAQCAALGLLVPNYLIRRAAYQCVANDPRISLLPERQVTAIQNSANAVLVRSAKRETFHGRLLVGADSRFSDVRRAMGIAADMLDFGKTMLLCRMRHELPHGQIAWEWFQDDCTLALLPLKEQESSIVVTVPAAEALRLMEFDASAFNSDIEARFDRRLGAMRLTSTRHTYPLVAAFSRRFAGSRCALIGDAAVGMHPVTAHGFNLGLQSQDCLVRELAGASMHGIDIGSPQVLQRYEAAHKRNSRGLYVATNAIVRLYTDARPLHKLCRSVGLRLADRIGPVKHFVLDSLTEMGDRSDRATRLRRALGPHW